MSKKQLWYTRRDMEIRGPFPAGMVTRYILLGRILETDQLSTDQVSWRPVSDLPELIPEELKLDLTNPENREKLRIARMREDERGTDDRRSENESSNTENSVYVKRGNDRRKAEPMDVMRHREIKTQLLTSLREKQQKHYIPRMLGILMAISAIIATVWWYG
ncbi:MAG: hypothetical protein PVF34_11375 [Gammaproteobacteria bacterium]|jgi:hypothetical protein